MRQNYNRQIPGVYDASLHYGPTVSFPISMTIPLFITQSDIPIRKPKITEMNTIGTLDDNLISEWSSHVMFYGGQNLLTTTLQGYFLTPTTLVEDQYGQEVRQLNPTQPDPSLLGYSYADVVWAYLKGSLNQATRFRFKRTDPDAFTDPYGNVYNNPIIKTFDSQYTVWPTKQTFELTLYLEV